MPDPTGDAKGIGYSRQDERTRRLWDTQIGKANPWEHRGQKLDADADEAAPQAADAPTVSEAPSAPMIAQQDRLRLHRPVQAVENPFERLIEHQLHLKLPDQDT
jgi:hypothetical protein